MKVAKVFLFDKNGDVQFGLNWGQRPERKNKDEAYLQLSPDVWHSDFFPINGNYFIVTTDDNESFALNRASKNEEGTQLNSPENNGIIGKYIRKRLGVNGGDEITKADIEEYGRSDIDFYKISERQYKMNFASSRKCFYYEGTIGLLAKKIIDTIYTIDKFNKISSLFIDGALIKIRDDKMFSSNKLALVFTKPTSSSYSEDSRNYQDSEYILNINGIPTNCKLSNQWRDKDDSSHDGNYLYSLIELVNYYYENKIEVIRKTNGIKIIHFSDTSPTEALTTFALSSVLKSSPTPESSPSLRYIRSLLAKPFAILTGNSGTGKTRIALNLAKYLEKTSTDGNHKNSLLIPVGADWTDNTKLLGFYNPMTHRYQSTATLDFILNARKNPDIPFFLILDEMNLSHVERYFSDFLSAMESGENIPLYKKDVDCKEEVIPESIELPKNLFVTGTVNIDETTYMFSPKVLDRANVIEFKPKDEEVLNLFSEDSKNIEVVTAVLGVAEAFLEISKKVRDSQLANYSLKSFNEAKDKLQSLYKILEESGFEFAFRTVKEIRYYVIVACELSDKKDEFDVTSVLDEQIVQKILPKIHGNKKQIGTLLDELKSVCNETSYKLSKAKITQMKSRLEKYQYASFI